MVELLFDEVQGLELLGGGLGQKGGVSFSAGVRFGELVVGGGPGSGLGVDLLDEGGPFTVGDAGAFEGDVEGPFSGLRFLKVGEGVHFYIGWKKFFPARVAMRVSSGIGSTSKAGGGKTSTHGVGVPRTCQAGASARGAEVISVVVVGKATGEGWGVTAARVRERGAPRPRRRVSR